MAYRLRTHKAFGEEFRTVATEQLNKAVRLLEEQPDGMHQAVHQARKRLKRVRALYRLIQSDEKEFHRRENARIRGIAQSLSIARDATALIETVDYLSGFATSAEEKNAIAIAATALTARRDRIAHEEHQLPARMADAAAACREAIAALGELSLADGAGHTGRRLARNWRRERTKALTALAACDMQADADAFHDLRKAGQTYWMHLALLAEIWPSAMKAKQADAKALVDMLGHEHDISVLTQLLNEQSELFGSAETLALLIGAIITRQDVLRRDASSLAHVVFAEDPEQESALIALLWKNAARTAAGGAKPG